ncbi:hypothetical protein [Streptomyces himalayensis]|uniref:Uncharacterized protein n=1 Tax=Streptomyces himalayensis subsp. himalayensis TaxID=2756131 RepID=A0A7W0DUR7_9ACTN|nr:hypothetical protein [Streptomyces himalayensis]MBA2951614.1 hypothetical protein [Streptomyces himalayensis subsp. himalayensis]
MAVEIVPAPHGADRPTAPLPVLAADALRRLELAMDTQTVANFDSHGSLWGFSTTEEAEELIAEERAVLSAVDEWETVDRDGQPLRVVRIADPTFLDTICVFSTWNTASKAVA